MRGLNLRHFKLELARRGSITGTPHTSRVSLSRPSWRLRPCGKNVFTTEWSREEGHRYLILHFGTRRGYRIVPFRQWGSDPRLRGLA